MFANQAFASDYIAKITEYGIYNVDKPKSIEFPEAMSGKAQQGEGVLQKKTTVIPLIKNTFFGYKFTISNIDDESVKLLTLVIEHPSIVALDGISNSRLAMQIRKRPKNGVITSQIGYVLNQDYEMVPGEWTLEVFLDKKMILEKTFTTVTSNKTPPEKSGGV